MNLSRLFGRIALTFMRWCELRARLEDALCRWPKGEALVLLGILGVSLFLTGCATDPFCDDTCPDACAVDCLPETFGQTPPAATIAHMQRCAERIPYDAIPAPPGTYMKKWREENWAAALQHHRVITRNEWFSKGDELSPNGIHHVGRISAAMAQAPDWVVIETEPVLLEKDEEYEEALQRIRELQERRRQVVVDALVAGGFVDANDWVIFGEDRTVGVRGIEAPQIFNRQFQGIGGAGNRGGLGRGGFGGGLGGGGFGGGFGGIGGGIGRGGFGGGGIF